MEQLVLVTIIGLLSGITGTGIGGFAAFFVNDINKRNLSFIIEFSAGLMISIVCFELLPESFKVGGRVATLLGFILGVICIVFLENYIKRLEIFKKRSKNSGLLRAGVLVAIGIALHNLPEGFALGSGFEASIKLGFTLTGVIMIHDIAEGVAMAVPLRAGGFSKIKAFALTVLSGVPMGIGAFLGACLGQISGKAISICLGFAGGAMIYIIFAEMVAESKKMYQGRMSSMGNVLGIIFGIVLSVYN